MICPIPWNHLAIRNNGDLRVCCQANQGPDKGLLRREDGSIYHASDIDINESRNSQKMKDIRKKLLENEWHEDCIRCMNEENSNIRSRFTYESENWEHIIDEDYIRTNTNPDGSIDTRKFPARHYDIRFGNKCNLKCRMCGPTDSSAWYEDNIKLWGICEYDESGRKMRIIKKENKYTVKENIYEWYKSENFWNFMKNNLKVIRLVHMVGGEALLIKEHYKFLQMCIDGGFSKDIMVEYNTNGTIVTDSLLDMWKQFKRVQIGVSIDGVGDVNDYVRYPSKFDKVQENLKKMCFSLSNANIWTAHTVSAINITELPDYLEWLNNLKIPILNTAKGNILGVSHPLHGPKHLNIKMFPKEIKDKIKEHFDNYVFSKNEKRARAVLNKYIKFMYQDQYDEKLFDKFKMVMTRLDEIRNQSLEKSIPRLYNLIKEYDASK